MKQQNGMRRVFWQTAGDLVENAITHNIVLAQALGLMPVIAAGVTLKNGVMLTVCTAVVMIPLSIVLSLIGNRLAKWLRPAVYAVLASLLLVATSYILNTWISPELYAQLYLYIPLIAVNMMYSRSVGFASTIQPLETILDALGSTIGFGLVICIISAIREFAISGTIWGAPLNTELVLPEAAAPFAAFIVLGFMSALLQWTRQSISAYFSNKEAEHE